VIRPLRQASVHISVIALALLLAIPAAAQEPVPTRFFIENIVVRDAERVSPDVVIAESRLSPGESYSEADLRDASARLGRLPFLLSADFSLEKGSERGLYILVLTVNETKPFFYALDLRPILQGDPRVEPDYSDRVGLGDNEATLGARWFFGRRGAMHIALITTDYNEDIARDYIAFAVGYTQYDLFGTRAFATLNAKHVLIDGTESLSPQLVVGVPLSPNQTLTVDVDQTRFGDSERELLGETFSSQRGQRVITATWSYNTTNRPFLPTRGTLLSVRPRISWSDVGTSVIIVDGDVAFVQSLTVHSQAREITASAAKYWELSERSSVSGGVEGGWADFDRRSDDLTLIGRDHALRATAFAGFSYSIWDRDEMKYGDSKFELNVRIGDHSPGPDTFYRTDHRQASASWVRRSSYGTLRLGVGYAW
jgi:hypothetical protein